MRSILGCLVLFVGSIAVAVGCGEAEPRSPQVVAQHHPASNWQLVYSFDREPTSPSFLGGREYVWIELNGDGRVTYNETSDAADSNSSYKSLTIQPALAREIRGRVTGVVGELLWFHPLEYEHLEYRGHLHGRVDGRELQMPVPDRLDDEVRAAFEPVLVLARESEWTYDMYGRHLNP